MKKIILGIDPGSRITGFGVISVDGDHIEHLDHGLIRLKEEWSLPERLKCLNFELQHIYAQFKIHTTAVEKIFFGKNADSAFKLGHARGVCLMVASQNASIVAEYAARYVKKCVTGSGAASKDHVQMVVFSLLGLKLQKLAFDATDALSLAITHARVDEVSVRVKKAMEVEGL